MRYSLLLSQFNERNFTSKELTKFINAISTYKQVPNYFEGDGVLSEPFEVLSDFFCLFVGSERFAEIAEDEEFVKNLFFKIFETSGKNISKVVKYCHYALTHLFDDFIGYEDVPLPFLENIIYPEFGICIYLSIIDSYEDSLTPFWEMVSHNLSYEELFGDLREIYPEFFL